MNAQPPPARDFLVFVRDANDEPLHGAIIRFSLNGVPAGEVPNAEGRGSIHNLKVSDKLEITVTYRGVTKTASPGPDQTTWVFKFDLHSRRDGKRLERFLAFTFGVVFIIALLALAIIFPSPTPFQYLVFRIILALAAAGVAVTFTGFLEIAVSSWIKAGGALAVFVIVFFYNPADLIAGQVGQSYKAKLIGTQATPGQLSGVVFDIYLDNHLLSRFDNRLSAPEIDAGKLIAGPHTFRFENITGYFMNPAGPQLMPQASGLRCDGQFIVAQDKAYQVVVWLDASGLKCDLR
jgi:hypothetical protein